MKKKNNQNDFIDEVNKLILVNKTARRALFNYMVNNKDKVKELKKAKAKKVRTKIMGFRVIAYVSEERTPEGEPIIYISKILD